MKIHLIFKLSKLIIHVIVQKGNLETLIKYIGVIKVVPKDVKHVQVQEIV